VQKRSDHRDCGDKKKQQEHPFHAGLT